MSTQALQFSKRTNVLYIEQLFPDAHIRYWQCALAGCRTIYWAEINPQIDSPNVVLYEGYCSDECEQVDEILAEDAKNQEWAEINAKLMDGLARKHGMERAENREAGSP